eukprot:jgi/Tetstr1/461194/TSEL_006331.t1
MLPILGDPPGSGTAAVPLEISTAALLALRHIAFSDCSVLGEGCQTLLDVGATSGGEGDAGARVVLKPYLYNMDSLAPGAAPAAVQACASTDSSVIIASFSSPQSSLVASFVGGLGHMLISSAATSPNLRRKDLYPSFARTMASQGGNLVATVHLARHFGWRQIASLYNQDVLGSQLNEVLTEEAQSFELSTTAISLGISLTDREVDRAARQLVQTGIKVVVLITVNYELYRIMSIIKEAMDELGEDYFSYTFISATLGTKGMVAANRDIATGPDKHWPLFEGLLGVNAQLEMGPLSKLQAGLSDFTAQQARQDIATYMNASQTWPGDDNFDDAAWEANYPSTGATAFTMYEAASYDAIWLAAIGVAAAAKTKPIHAVTGTDVMKVISEEKLPPFMGAGGWRSFLPNGDVDLGNTPIEITNYGTLPGATEPRHATVALLNLTTKAVVMIEGETIVWANGKLYPYVPPDGSHTRNILLPVLIASLVFLVLLGLLSGFLTWRNKRLVRRVDTLMGKARNGLELESPMAKMLDFLHRYQGTNRQQPSLAEARRLEDLIVSHSGALTVPDLEEELRGSGFTVGIKGFLLSNIFGTWSARDFFLDLVTPRSLFLDNGPYIQTVALQCTQSWDLLDSDIERRRLAHFSMAVEAGYPDTHYHCKKHGADVTARVMAMIHHAGLMHLPLSPGQRGTRSVGLLAMVAAMIHDYGHPQVNNAFLMEQEDKMALDFNNQAVAEHYALREAMKLLMVPETNFLSNSAGSRVSKSAVSDRKWFRNMAVELVLATDMSRHFDLLSQFETQIVKNRELLAKGAVHEMWQAMTDHQRTLTLQIALKVADVGHCALPMDIHREWVKRLEEEFFLQGDKEKARGQVKISALMDREKPGASAPENQIGFFKVIVLPTIKAWTDVFPGCLPLLEQAEANLRYYTAQAEQNKLPRPPSDA